jgi:hypothetical protein
VEEAQHVPCEPAAAACIGRGRGWRDHGNGILCAAVSAGLNRCVADGCGRNRATVLRGGWHWQGSDLCICWSILIWHHRYSLLLPSLLGAQDTVGTVYGLVQMRWRLSWLILVPQLLEIVAVTGNGMPNCQVNGFAVALQRWCGNECF